MYKYLGVKYNLGERTSVEILFYLILLIMIYGKLYDSRRNRKMCAYNKSLSCVMYTPMHYNALLTSNKFVYIAGKEEMNNIEFYF